MNQLIPINPRTINNQSINTVNARDLHSFLEVKSEFRNWIKNRISDFDFIEGIDFIAGKFLPASDMVDYHITIDMAKELSMVERNQKGKEARQYFIECEKLAKQSTLIDPKVQLANAVLIAQQVILEQTLLIETQAHKIEEDQPKVKFYDKYMNADGLLTIRDAARCFNCQEEAFKSFLRLIKMIEKCTKKHAAMAEARRAGFMRYVPSSNPNGTLGTSYVTPLGMEHIELRKERCKRLDPKTYSIIFEGNEW